jgi:hypothetical protein
MNQLVLQRSVGTLEQTTLALVGGIITSFEVVEQSIVIVCDRLRNDERYRFRKNPSSHNDHGWRLNYLRRCFNAPGPLNAFSRVGKLLLTELDQKDIRTYFAHSAVDLVHPNENGFTADFVRLQHVKGGLLGEDRRQYNESELRAMLRTMRRAARLAKASYRYLQRRGIVAA